MTRTSSRKVEGKRRLSPRAVGEELVARAAQGPVGVVFGDERSGLTNAEVERCHDNTRAAQGCGICSPRCAAHG